MKPENIYAFQWVKCQKLKQFAGHRIKKSLNMHKQKTVTNKMKLLIKELPGSVISVILFDNFINYMGEE